MFEGTRKKLNITDALAGTRAVKVPAFPFDVSKLADGKDRPGSLGMFAMAGDPGSPRQYDSLEINL